MFRCAALARTGDEVLLEGNEELTPVKIINISSVMMQGNNIPELKANQYAICSFSYT